MHVWGERFSLCIANGIRIPGNAQNEIHYHLSVKWLPNSSWMPCNSLSKERLSAFGIVVLLSLGNWVLEAVQCCQSAKKSSFRYLGLYSRPFPKQITRFSSSPWKNKSKENISSPCQKDKLLTRTPFACTFKSCITSGTKGVVSLRLEGPPWKSAPRSYCHQERETYTVVLSTNH